MNFRSILFALVIASISLAPTAQAMDSAALACTSCINPNETINYGYLGQDFDKILLTKLDLACKNNHPKCLKALLAKWYIIDEYREDSLLLDVAIKLNHIESVKLLLENGIEINPAEYCNTPLQSAIRANRLTITRVRC